MNTTDILIFDRAISNVMMQVSNLRAILSLNLDNGDIKEIIDYYYNLDVKNNKFIREILFSDILDDILEKHWEINITREIYERYLRVTFNKIYTNSLNDKEEIFFSRYSKFRDFVFNEWLFRTIWVELKLVIEWIKDVNIKDALNLLIVLIWNWTIELRKFYNVDINDLINQSLFNDIKSKLKWKVPKQYIEIATYKEYFIKIIINMLEIIKKWEEDTEYWKLVINRYWDILKGIDKYRWKIDIL